MTSSQQECTGFDLQVIVGNGESLTVSGLQMLVRSGVSLKDVQAHVETCKSCKTELQTGFEMYIEYPQLGDVPAGITDIEEYLKAWQLKIRQGSDRYGYAVEELKERVSTNEVIDATRELFSYQSIILQLIGLGVSRARVERYFGMLGEKYRHLSELLGDDLFSFFMGGKEHDADKEEVIDEILLGWNKLMDSLKDEEAEWSDSAEDP